MLGENMIEEIQKDILKAMEVEENFFKIIRPIVQAEVTNQLTPLQLEIDSLKLDLNKSRENFRA